MNTPTPPPPHHHHHNHNHHLPTGVNNSLLKRFIYYFKAPPLDKRNTFWVRDMVRQTPKIFLSYIPLLWLSHQAIIWTNVGLLIWGKLGISFSEILLKMQQFSYKILVALKDAVYHLVVILYRRCGSRQSLHIDIFRVDGRLPCRFVVTSQHQ